MRQSLGLKICWEMEIKIDETYHVAPIAERQNSPCITPTLGNPFFPKSQSRMCTKMGENAGKYSRGCSRTVSFVFEQSDAPFPARGLIVLVTRCPELSAFLNCAGHDLNGFGPPF